MLLDQPGALAARKAMLDAAHMRNLETWRTVRTTETHPLPHFDPLDGGDQARILLLLETPGPGATPLRFVSRDNATGTARNLRRFLVEASIARQDSVLWNTVPWVIHAAGARSRAPRAAEIELGLLMLPDVIERLPKLQVVVLAGRIAAAARQVVECSGRDLNIVTMPHPSPTYVCTSPVVADDIRTALRAAAAHLQTTD